MKRCRGIILPESGGSSAPSRHATRPISMTRSERSNPQSGEAFFVMAFLAWQTGEREEAVRRLEQAAATRSENRKPAGVVAEGEVRQKMHVEAVPCEDLYDA